MSKHPGEKPAREKGMHADPRHKEDRQKGMQADPRHKAPGKGEPPRKWRGRRSQSR